MSALTPTTDYDTYIVLIKHCQIFSNGHPSNSFKTKMIIYKFKKIEIVTEDYGNLPNFLASS